MKKFAIAISFTALISSCATAREWRNPASGQDGVEVPLAGDPGSVVSADFDGDAHVDLALIVAKQDFSRSLFIFWGHTNKKFSSSTEIPLGLVVKDPVRPSMRDTTSHSLVSADFNKDGAADIGTSVGFAINQGKRKFRWQDLHNRPTNPKLPGPVAVLEYEGTNQLLVRVDGGIDSCSATACKAVIRSPFLQDSLRVPSEMQVLDLDGDGTQDILAGSERLDRENSYIWLGKDRFKADPMSLHGVPPVDIQQADLDGDGHLDLLAQVKEFISDFPSETRIFLNHSGKLDLLGKFSNFDNHNDNATLVAKKDGCFDLYQVGVDRGVGRLTAQKGENGYCDFSKSQFQQVLRKTGTGVQCLNLGMPKCTLVVRRAFDSEHSGSLWLQEL